MNGSDFMRERESMGEKKESHGCCRSTCVVEEKERKRWTHMCLTKNIIRVTRFCLLTS
jgi:hypothetical protein